MNLVCTILIKITLIIHQCGCVISKGNGRIILIKTHKNYTVIGSRLGLSCLIPNFTTTASWAKNLQGTLTDCNRKICTVESDGRFKFDSNNSGIFMEIKNLTYTDTGNWTCTLSETEHITYELKRENILYPPSSCSLTVKGEVYECKTSCTYPRDRLFTSWNVNGGDLELKYTPNNQDVCRFPAKEYISTLPINGVPTSRNHILYCAYGFKGYQNFTVTCHLEVVDNCCRPTYVGVFILHCIVVGFITTLLYLKLSAKMETIDIEFSIGSRGACTLLCYNGFCVITTLLWLAFLLTKILKDENPHLFLRKILLLQNFLVDAIVAIVITVTVALVCELGCPIDAHFVVLFVLPIVLSFGIKLVCIFWKIYRRKDTVNTAVEVDSGESSTKDGPGERSVFMDDRNVDKQISNNENFEDNSDFKTEEAVC